MSTENNISTSLANAINEHCRQFEASPEFNEMVAAHVRKLYDDAIKDVFRWGKFPDAVKEALKEALPANITAVCDLPRYNLLLARTLDEQWKANAVSENLVTQMQELVKGFIEQDQTPKFIKASDLWAAYIEDNQEEAAHEGWEAPQVVINDDDRDGFFYIGFEKEPASESSYGFLRKERKEKAHSCEVYLGFHQKTIREERTDKPVMQDGHPVYSLFSGQLEYGDALGKKPVQFRGKFEKLVGALYYGDSLLVLDARDADDIYYPSVD
ncbi:hypothetical protein SopranoGao_58 [Klebsiella phage SopranoGao]|uniref:Uncharacterized protein n=1 Tax=Klebsiella phage SopranoGao TaxID=2026944 RepID=A0A248SL66_9CAUD|nr:hypothetical protein KMC54_gp58 [Klebsiella phage SopranoGao]ASV45081.1 hypothetical protein SopranoGao_58 [Klebsiella phage SopranoGao]